jgi:predicted  nucleic acid-binding Zn-ribbon protein
LSIYQKIKLWLEKARAWLAEPATSAVLMAYSQNSMTLAIFQQNIQKLEDQFHSDVTAMRQMLGQRIDLIEDRILDKLYEHRRQLDTIEGDIEKSEEGTARAMLNMINRIENRFFIGEDQSRRLFEAIDDTQGRIHELEVLFAGLCTRLGSENQRMIAQMQRVETELQNIRSRYQWVEDRYNDLAKGKEPREFDFEHRQ